MINLEIVKRETVKFPGVDQVTYKNENESTRT